MLTANCLSRTVLGQLPCAFGRFVIVRDIAIGITPPPTTEHSVEAGIVVVGTTISLLIILR
jgi:hypothetical protein